MNAADFILENAVLERVAVMTETAQLTYAELLALVGGAARALAGLGVAKGDRVGLVADNSPFWIASYLGTLLIGAIAVPIAPTVRPDQLAALARAAGCRAFALETRHRARFVDALPPGTATLSEIAPGPSPPDPGVPVDDRHDLAALMFTSGSTGSPRAVMVSHRNVIANTSGIVEYLGLGPDDRVMVVLPFHYCFGTSLLHTHLRAGGSVVLNNRFAFPQVVLDHLERSACTGFAGVPSTYQILLRNSSLPRRKLPSLRMLQQAGGKLPNVCIEELRAALPAASLYVMYGQTEATARLSYLPPAELATRLGSIGRGMPGVELRVLRADGTPVGEGEVGEIVARGDNITLGYWEDPVETAHSFRDGALWTGDLARVDGEGYVFIVDRAKDFIKASGHRVAAKEIEDAIMALPDVVETAVIGVPDDITGEAVKAFVVVRRGATLTAEEIVAHCRRALARYMVPREVAMVSGLPKNEAGKVEKRQLRAPPAAIRPVAVEPLVSVCIPSYNRAHVIAQTLDSALAQTYPRLEIIVVDDGSKDDTEAAVAPYRDRVVYVRQPNGGLAAARNTGLARATGEYVAWLDSDDLWNPEKIALQMAFMRAHPDHVLIASDFSAFDENGFFEASHVRAYYGRIDRTPGGFAGVFRDQTMLPTRGVPYLGAELPAEVRVYHGQVYEQLVHGNCLHPPTALFRRDAALRAGELDRTFRKDVDWEFFIRLSREGRVAYVDHPLMRYRYSADQMSSDAYRADIASSRVLVLEAVRRRDPRLAATREFRRRLGFCHAVAANVLADGERLPAARHLLACLGMRYVDGQTARALAKLVLPRALVAAVRKRPPPA